MSERVSQECQPAELTYCSARPVEEVELRTYLPTWLASEQASNRPRIKRASGPASTSLSKRVQLSQVVAVVAVVVVIDVGVVVVDSVVVVTVVVVVYDPVKNEHISTRRTVRTQTHSLRPARLSSEKGCSPEKLDLSERKPVISKREALQSLYSRLCNRE